MSYPGNPVGHLRRAPHRDHSRYSPSECEFILPPPPTRLSMVFLAKINNSCIHNLRLLDRSCCPRDWRILPIEIRDISLLQPSDRHTYTPRQRSPLIRGSHVLERLTTCITKGALRLRFVPDVAGG